MEGWGERAGRDGFTEGGHLGLQLLDPVLQRVTCVRELTSRSQEAFGKF